MSHWPTRQSRSESDGKNKCQIRVDGDKLKQCNEDLKAGCGASESISSVPVQICLSVTSDFHTNT